MITQSSAASALAGSVAANIQNAAHSAQNTIHALRIITPTFTTNHCPFEGPQ